MADIDLKTATPDTSLPTTGFLFGADSQASASPSVYSTQTVATTLLGSTSLTGATITTSQPVLDLAQTWNAGAVTFTGLRYNATDTASAAASLLMDLQVGGSSKFKVDKGGNATAVSYYVNGSTLRIREISGGIGFVDTSGNAAFIGYGRIAGKTLALSESDVTSPDTFLTRRAAANLRLGAADAAGSAISISSVAIQQITLASNHGLSNGAAVQVTFTAGGAVPAGTAVNTTYYARSISAAVLELYGTYDQALNTASTTGRVNVTSAGTTAFINRAAPFQTLSVQSFTGTDIPGQPFVITGSQGTGTGAGGSIIFQVAPAGSTGTAQNVLATALTIDSTGQVTFVDAGAQAYIKSGGRASFYSGRFTAGSGANNPWVTIADNTLGVNLADAAPLSWCNNSSAASGTADVILRRDTSNTLALRNANNGQTFRIYGRFTDITNDFERFFINAPTTSGAAVQLGTQKGATTGAARALEFQTDGTTRLTIGSAGGLTLADAQDIAVGSTTGTKIGTATTQKIGFYNKAPVVQPTAVADATDNATAITQLNALLSRMRDLGLIAT